MMDPSHDIVSRNSDYPSEMCINCMQCSCHNMVGLQYLCPVPEQDRYHYTSLKEGKFVKQVLDAFKSLLKPGDKAINAKEFSEMWSSCSDELKETLKANAAEMGFKAGA